MGGWVGGHGGWGRDDGSVFRIGWLTRSGVTRWRQSGYVQILLLPCFLKLVSCSVLGFLAVSFLSWHCEFSSWNEEVRTVRRAARRHMRRLMEVADGGGPSLRKSKKLLALSEISVIYFRAKDQPETKIHFWRSFVWKCVTRILSIPKRVLHSGP